MNCKSFSVAFDKIYSHPKKLDELKKNLIKEFGEGILYNWTNDYYHLEWEGYSRNENLHKEGEWIMDYPICNWDGVDLYEIFQVKKPKSEDNRKSDSFNEQFDRYYDLFDYLLINNKHFKEWYNSLNEKEKFLEVFEL